MHQVDIERTCVPTASVGTLLQEEHDDMEQGKVARRWMIIATLDLVILKYFGTSEVPLILAMSG
jgi:hypothetical protein